MAGPGHKQPQGRRTHEQQQRVINRQENTKGADIEGPGETINEARQHQTPPTRRYDNESGDRSIQRGANQESEHHKDRTDT